jgi:hypothetical protein
MITAAALFFYMVFASICTLLLGRLLIRGAYYICLFWRFGGGKHGNSLTSRLKSIIILASKIVWPGQSIQQQQVKSSSNGIKVKGRFPVLIAFQRPFRRVFKSALFLSAVLCFLYSHCWSRPLSAFDVSKEEGGIVCRGVFLPMLLFGFSKVHTTGLANCHTNHSCADERSIWILWAAAILFHLLAYFMHEFAGKHHKDYHTRSCSSSQKTQRGAAEYGLDNTNSSSGFDIDSQFLDVDSNDNMEVESEERGSISGSISATFQKLTKLKLIQPEDTLSMVSWYSNMVLSGAFDLLVSYKIFLGRFDARKMQVALLNEAKGVSGQTHGKESVFDFSHCKHSCKMKDSNEEGFWLDWVSIQQHAAEKHDNFILILVLIHMPQVSDCGDGFNSSYQVSRVLAQPSLNVSTASPSSKCGGRKNLPRGKLLINGGDLAYPDPTPYSYENRFFRTFEDAMPPPPSFRREHISIRKPALPVKGWSIDTDNDETDKKSESEDLLSSYQGMC